MKEYYIEDDYESLAESGMMLFEQRVPENSVAASGHIHETIEFIYTLCGSYDIYANDAHYEVGAGEMLLFRSNTIHRIYSREEKKNVYYVLKIKPSLIYELATDKNAAGYILRFSLDGGKVHWNAQELEKSGIKASLERLVAEEKNSGICKDVAIKVEAFSVVLATLRALISEDGGYDTSLLQGNIATQIYKTIKHISRSYGEELDAEKCARAVNMSYSYFSRSFKRVTGKSFKDYLNFVRINQAERLLASSEKSVMDIALECGYNNVSYFIMLFKKHKGITPLAYRKNIQ